MAHVPAPGNAVPLRFRGPHTPAPGNAVPLVFGVLEDTPPVEPVARAVSMQTRMPWRRPAAAVVLRYLRFRQAARGDTAVRASWRPGAALEQQLRLPWAPLHAGGRQVRAPISQGAPLQLQARMPWINPQQLERITRLRWQQAQPADQAPAALPWLNAAQRTRLARLPWTEAQQLDHQVVVPWEAAVRMDRQHRLPWGMGQRPRYQLLPIPPHINPPPPYVPPCHTPAPGHAVPLRFRGSHTPAPGNAVPLVFECAGKARRFDIRRTLSVQHHLSCVRLPDMLPLAITAFSASHDRDSWSWTYRLAFADVASLVAVEPMPTGKHKVLVNVDGYEFLAEINGYNEGRDLDARDGSVGGRSTSAALNREERAYIQAVPMTAQQLAERELEFTGFSLDWQLPFDWTVPAGAGSYERLTRIGALLRIAAAAGAMVQTAPDSDTIRILPRMPSAAWAFDDQVPDFTLAGGSWFQKGKNYTEGGQYNGAVISGLSQGVTVIAHRAGTSGSPYAQQIVDPLNTDTQPALARAVVIVSDSADRQEIPVVMEMIPSPGAPGLLMAGELGAIEDTVWGHYRAMVDAGSINAQVDNEGLLTVEQSVTLWRYLPVEVE